MARYTIILNPQTLSKQRKKYNALRSALPVGSVEVFESQNAADITRLARTALEKGTDFLLPVGGDGTLSLVARAFMSQDKNDFPETALVPLDFGTGHDFYNGFVPQEFQGRWDWLTNGFETVRVSLGMYGNGPEQSYFLNSLSFGISSQIIEKRSRSRLRNGKVSYLVATLDAIWDYRARDLIVTHQGQRIERSTLLFLINKGPYIGGGMKFDADANHRSPQCHALWIEAKPLTWILRKLPEIYRGNVAKVEGVKTLVFEEIDLEFGREENFVEADGELCQVPRSIAVRILPECLTVVRPISR